MQGNAIQSPQEKHGTNLVSDREEKRACIVLEPKTGAVHGSRIAFWVAQTNEIIRFQVQCRGAPGGCCF